MRSLLVNQDSDRFLDRFSLYVGIGAIACAATHPRFEE
jgi:hypothetical protein